MESKKSLYSSEAEQVEQNLPAENATVGIEHTLWKTKAESSLRLEFV